MAHPYFWPVVLTGATALLVGIATVLWWRVRPLPAPPSVPRPAPFVPPIITINVRILDTRQSEVSAQEAGRTVSLKPGDAMDVAIARERSERRDTR